MIATTPAILLVDRRRQDDGENTPLPHTRTTRGFPSRSHPRARFGRLTWPRGCLSCSPALGLLLLARLLPTGSAPWVTVVDLSNGQQARASVLVGSVAALLFFSLVSASMSFGAQQPNHNPNGDKEVPNAATDGISCVAWSPAANYVAAMWDNQVHDLFLKEP